MKGEYVAEDSKTTKGKERIKALIKKAKSVQLDDFGIFEVTSKSDKNWIDTIRIQSNRRSGGFPKTKIYPV